MSQPSEDARLAFMQKRFQQRHANKRRSAASRPMGEDGRDPWETFQGTGLNVDRLRALEKQSIEGQPSRPASKNPSDESFRKNRERLLKHISAERVLKETSSKLSHPPAHPNDVPEQIFPGATYYAQSEVYGGGLGWSQTDSEADGWVASWWYEFFPPKDGIYLISSFPSAWGHVWGHAHDQWWNSKDFHLRVASSVESFQGDYNGDLNGVTDAGHWLPIYVGTTDYFDGQVMFESEHGSYTLDSEITCPQQLQIQTVLDGGISAFIQCAITADAYAQGAGAYCGFSLGLGVLFTAWQLIE